MHERSLLLDAIVYLAAAVVFVPLASRLRLGSVLGYLAAGCLIGRFGFGFVTDPTNILHFSEFGVVLMLFLIGLELEPSRLWQMRRSVFGGGAAQMLLCGLLLCLGARGAGLPWKGAVIAGLALALSSTAIALQTLRERALLGSPMGRAAFAVLLFQDVAAIPLIAAVPLLADGGGGGMGISGVLKVVGAVIGVVVIGRYATRPALRAIAKTGLREVFTAFSLLLVMAIAQLMQLAGVSMALGAFLAGVLLAGSEYRHALETDIEPFKGLLMGLFFIAVGMSIDFGLLRDEPVRVLLLLLGLLLLKVLGLWALAPRLGVRGEGALFAALLSQGGEFAFVVLGQAGKERVLPAGWDQRLTLVVALSMALTPLLVLAAGAFCRAREAERREEDTIEPGESQVIIAGFGRFGQIVGRLLFASGHKATVLDYSPDQIDLLRRFDFRVFYGDATRLDLLESAGAHRARVLVNAIDDVDANLRLVDLVRQHFPHLRIVCRARNVTHYYALRERGVTLIEREMFDSALRAGRDALEALGVGAYEARERAESFRRQNLAGLEELRDTLDEAQRVARARAARDQLEKQFQRDIEELDTHIGGSWRRG